MRFARCWLLATALPLFAGCSLPAFFHRDAALPALTGQSRMQGSLAQQGGQWVFTPCDTPRSFIVTDNSGTNLLQDAQAFGVPLYADVRGRFDGNPVEGQAGALNLQTVYRLERTDKGCKDKNFKLSQFYADGKGWVARANPQGLLIEREGQPPLAVPFVEEQAPGGGTSLSSDANDQHIQLWLAPQRCDAPARVSYLSAELRVGSEVLHGCGYLGGARAQ